MKVVIVHLVLRLFGEIHVKRNVVQIVKIQLVQKTEIVKNVIIQNGVLIVKMIVILIVMGIATN